MKPKSCPNCEVTNPDSPTCEEMLVKMDAYRQGMDRGRELAIQQYDKAFVELADKMDHIMRKLDAVLEARDK